MNIWHLFCLDVRKLLSIRMMAAFIVLPALATFNGWFVSIAYLVYLYLVTYGIFSYDDNVLADNLYGMLPVKREQIVSARYLFGLASMLLEAALMVGVHTLYCLAVGLPLLSPQFTAPLALSMAVGCCFIAVAYPLVLVQGARKANNYVLMLFVIAFIACGIYSDNLAFGTQAQTLPQGNLPGLLGLCLLAYAVSLQVCLRYYRHKQYHDYKPLADVHRAKRGKGFLK